MTALVRAELLKLRTVAPAVCGCCSPRSRSSLLGVLATVLTAGLEGAPLQRDDPELLARARSRAPAAATSSCWCSGILALTQEFRFGTATPSFLVTPRRGAVLAAKLRQHRPDRAGVRGRLARRSRSRSSWLTISCAGDALRFDATVVEVMLGVGLVLALYGPIGVAVGALVRNQIAAVVGGAGLDVHRGAAARRPAARGRQVDARRRRAARSCSSATWPTTRGDLLPVWGGALLLVAYAVVLSVVGCHGDAATRPHLTPAPREWSRRPRGGCRAWTAHRRRREAPARPRAASRPRWTARPPSSPTSARATRSR